MVFYLSKKKKKKKERKKERKIIYIQECYPFIRDVREFTVSYGNYRTVE